MPDANGNDPTPFRVEPEVEGHDAYYFGDVPDDWMVCALISRELSYWNTKKDIPAAFTHWQVVQAKPPDPPKRTLRELIIGFAFEEFDHWSRAEMNVLFDALRALGVDPDEDMEGKELLLVEKGQSYPSVLLDGRVLVALDREDADFCAAWQWSTRQEGHTARLSRACRAALSRIEGRA